MTGDLLHQLQKTKCMAKQINFHSYADFMNLFLDTSTLHVLRCTDLFPMICFKNMYKEILIEITDS